MGEDTRSVLVMLSTGKQGSAVVRALAKANESSSQWLILAQTRDTTSARSKALESLPGVRLHKGTPTDPEALFTSAPGPIYAGVQGETIEANALADAAAKHGVKHFVYSSVQFGGAPEKKTYVPHFESKRLAEEYLEKTHPDMPRTILRPTTFMDQLVVGDPNSATSKITKTLFLTGLKPTTKLQLIACSDIGGVTALVLASPERYTGKDVDLAGDEMTPQDFEDGWREVFGEGMKPKMLGGGLLAWAIRVGMKEIRLMFRFFNEIGFSVNIAALHEEYPQLKDWKTFLRTEVKK
ncbi:nucleoside-diphosphate-sugar epimerase family protein [Roridomyces roridus]|uniref:Nucleoside-diphosphate-sugar epimerase family protein n=1 Tax=Roridomyces roridus TaxID=1738132 RepID=A0AAD7FU39_9AGAR|nr:nucleoside-diphosphate-sugar epimerase family protein [Roridomyces roridus]